MRKNIRYIRGNAGISIFYDTIFCFGGIYSRGWYLAKRNIAVYQIKATMAVAAEQQLHLKGCDVDVAVVGFLHFGVSRWACNELSIHTALWCANLIVIQDLRILKISLNVLCIRSIWRGKNDSTIQWRAKNSTDCIWDCLVDNKTDLDYILKHCWIYKIYFRSSTRKRVSEYRVRAPISNA